MNTEPATTAPAFVYYGKEIFSNPYFVQGRPIQFEPLDGNRGVLKLEANQANLPLITALNEAATARRGGIVKISAEEYEQKKNRYPFRPSAIKRTDMLQINRSAVAPIFKQPQQEEAGQGVPAAGGVKVDGFTPEAVPAAAPILPKPEAPATGEPAPAPAPSEMKSGFKPATGRASDRVKEPAAK